MVPVADTFQVYPLESGKSEIIGDTATDPRLTPQVRAISERLGVRSCLSIPLMNAGAAIGTLSVVAPTPYAFDPANVEPILSITEFLGVLINSNAQLATLLNNLLHSTAAPSHNRAAADFLASVVLPELSERDELERVIDEVLRHGRIDPVFQPIVELATGQVVAFEGLSRFASEPVRTPDVWMMMAHKVNRGVDMELTALRGLLDAALAIPDRYSVTVNLSPLALADAEVQQVLLAYPQKLVVELTEHEPAPELLSVSLEPVRRHGIKLAIDDAGSGFAGLTTILRLRPDIIKLDRELTIGIEDDPARRALATALSHFAGDIDAATVAEGIESDVQMQLLRDIGIRYGQGYHLARPQSVAALRDSVLSRP
ncbi:GAF sensor-containing diguanylate cyclase/phosphodiesterase [Comamonas testosteroni CNB-2] [Mycolicibacterium parafortuitum]|uniref:GAF sensor-containing diguanylate cyclase/phosphodiesterase [Comamonas testosteroni CNB-2] n=1 Tax=Mycolicibacterium parafortuitum TaxID=39692 RepID=A0A375YI54_MYCPF|nr:GAF sensor-containing diguanylate cyclase/phosphodiesterase [Comamonas testosteroni CNB-2] [Mycolicibacterium parafortuitum]